MKKAREDMDRKMKVATDKIAALRQKIERMETQIETIKKEVTFEHFLVKNEFREPDMDGDVFALKCEYDKEFEIEDLGDDILFVIIENFPDRTKNEAACHVPRAVFSELASIINMLTGGTK